MTGFYATWRIGLRDPRAISWIDDSIPGVWKSFFAAVLVAPYYAITTWLHLPQEIPDSISLPTLISVEAICYILSWLVFPLLVHSFCQITHREYVFRRFLAALNWSTLVQVVVLLPITLLDTTQIVPQDWLDSLFLAVGLLLYVYLGMIVHDTLKVPAIAIAGIVACGILIDIALLALGNNILGITS